MRTLAAAGERRALRARLETLAPTTPRRWGTLTAHEMLCHCADAFHIVVAARPIGSAVTPWRRTLVKWVALYLPMRWPHGVPTIPEADPHRAGTRPETTAAFERDRTRLVEAMEALAARSRDAPWPPHPMFGPLTAAQWLRWGWLHTDHHLRQFGA